MLQVAARVWNQVAAQGLATNLGKQLMTIKKDEDLIEAVDSLRERLLAKGLSPEVVRAYLLVGPLYAERMAIGELLMKRPQLMGALPEITSPDEAVQIATMEMNLTSSQQAEVKKLLSSLPT